MQRQIKWFLITIIIFIANYSYSQKQELSVEVIVDMEQMPPDVQDKLANFKRNVEDYLNKNKYLNIPLPNPTMPIKVQMQFSFTGVNTVTYNYEAKLFVASQRKVYNPFRNGPDRYSVAFRYLDERCEFFYNDNMPFVKNDNRFDSFLSLLDYYAYLIAGYDEDSYFVKGGSKYFQKALDICNKVTASLKGWNETGGGSKPSRLQLVQEILSSNFDNFRRAYFEYMWTGLDSLEIKKINAYRNMINALETISEVRKKEVKSYNIGIFFDGKATEIAETFIDYGDRSIYDKLIRMDPSHQSIYEEAKTRAH